MLTAIIIDDIAEARQNLREDLSAYCPNIKVIGEAEGVVSGAKLLRKKQGDLLFLDIQMPDGDGFDLLEIVPNLRSKVIFTTASDAYAIRAFRFSAVDYLLKPIDPDELMTAVQKAENQGISKQEAQLEVLLNNMKGEQQLKRLALHTQEKIHVTQIEDIVRMEADGNCTFFHFKDKTRLLVTKTLKEYDQLLSDHPFMRVHQSHLVNMYQIHSYIKTEGGYLLMKDGARVPVSVRKKPEVVRQLDAM